MDLSKLFTKLFKTSKTDNLPVEANSLTDITQIASNPPKYPRNPTEKQRSPLTLYLARVPGSQDIILTTLKPQLKNVTSEDVASSLYYLHVNTEDDARLLAEEEENAKIKKSAESDSETHKPLPRKPLPDSARASIDVSRTEETTASRPAFQATTSEYLRRKPLPEHARSSLDLDRATQAHVPDQSSQVILSKSEMSQKVHRKEVASREIPTQTHDQAKETIRRRPLGPRQIQSEVGVERDALPGVENQPMNSSLEAPGVVPSKTSSESARSDLSPFDNAARFDKSFSITIIRRDPSSGAQWNVGTLVGESNTDEMKSKKPYFDMSVHITPPGYMSFRDSPANSFNEKLSPLEMRQASVKGPSMAPSGFDRRIRMEGSSIWDRASHQHKRSRSDSLGKRLETRENVYSSAGVMPDGTADTRDSGSKGYVFLSPWGGRCKFSTGGGGRSLRCRHTIPDSLSSSNAVFESSGSAVVSELRFNLPHSAMFNAPAALRNIKSGVDSGRFSIPKFSHIRNKLSQTSRPPLPPRPPPTSYAAMYPSEDEEPPQLPPRLHTEQRMADSSDEQEHSPISVDPHQGYTPRSPTAENDERLDLTIGREKAGGGNRGKRAKLGKLIIHDEGFKMLDLVVAANMGVWWSVY